jgi:phage terminase large subunit-like protein
MTAVLIDQAMDDRALLGGTLGDPSSWKVWKAVLKGAFGVPLTDEQRVAFASVAGDREPPTRRVDELLCIVGRRGGKSRMAALISTFLATCIDHRKALAPGETGFVLCLSHTQRQAQLVLDYCRAFIEASPVLAQEIESCTTEEVRLKNNIVIAVHPANFRSIRGRTLLACTLDEAALFRDESASGQTDLEIVRAVTPGLLSTGGMLVAISTPYAERG